MDPTGPYQVNYSALDRFLHRLAFSAPAIQLTAADIEKRAFGAAYGGATAARPIFITSLPRAGTTLVLDILHRFPSLASHSYRDMPFVMAPIFWSRLSRAFRKPAELGERAHGDGMQVGYDSPEAFEEILWRTFWPDKYTDSRIALWGAADGNDDARAFFVEHMRKIIALRRPDRQGDGRYISKNNGNIARLALIGGMFPDAKVLVPFRDPVDHAASLHRQHANFMAMHKKEPFVRRYMADLGHYEFGELHRPIAFPGLDALIAGRDPLTPDYWLGYWIAAFDHVLAHRDAVVLVSYEALCAGGRDALAELCARLGIAEEGGMLDIAARLLRAPSARRVDAADLDPALRARAEELLQSLAAPAR